MWSNRRKKVRVEARKRRERKRRKRKRSSREVIVSAMDGTGNNRRKVEGAKEKRKWGCRKRRKAFRVKSGSLNHNNMGGRKRLKYLLNIGLTTVPLPLQQ